MRCHYCSREADVTARSGGVRVGLCDEHVRERIEELATAEPLAALEERLDVDTK